jgi:hypothetical protein
MNLFKQNEPQILVPFSTIIRLIIFHYMPDNTKIRIANNKIYYQYPSLLQGIIRWTNGDNRMDLHNICNAIETLIKWYYSDNSIIHFLLEQTIFGLTKLQTQYVNTILIQHSISHYINIIKTDLQNNINSNRQPIKKDMDANNKLDIQLLEIWSVDEIHVIYKMIKLLKTNNNSYNESIILSINNLLDSKDILAYNIIKKHTSYL